MSGSTASGFTILSAGIVFTLSLKAAISASGISIAITFALVEVPLIGTWTISSTCKGTGIFDEVDGKVRTCDNYDNMAGKVIKPKPTPAVVKAEPVPIKLKTEIAGEIEEAAAAAKPSALVAIETQVGRPFSGLFQLYQEAASLLQVAKKRTISTNEDLTPAADDMAIIAVCKKAMFARKKEIVGPLKSQLDAINNAFGDLIYPVEEADRLTRGKVNEFTTNQNNKAAEAKRIEDEKFKLAQEEAALSGTGEHTQELGTAIAPPPVPKTIRTDMGTLGGRSNWKARVVDFKLLDDQWKVPNDSLLNSHARTTKGERPVPGVVFYDDRIVTMRNK